MIYAPDSELKLRLTVYMEYAGFLSESMMLIIINNRLQ